MTAVRSPIFAPPFALALALALFALLSGARADGFEDANRAFAEGHYPESIQGYQAVIKKSGFSAPVLFNLANAEWRAGQVGRALLDYRRAQWLAPRDPDIQANLRYAEKQAGFPAADDAWTDRVAGLLSANAWAWLASVALTVLCAGVLASQFRPDWRWLRPVNAIAGLALIATATGVALRWNELNEAILVGPNTTAYLSPFSGAKKVIDFPAGQSVTVEKEHGDFLLVKTPNGQSGWVDRAQVDRIVPAA